MKHVAGTGRQGTTSFLIVNDDDTEYSVTVTTQAVIYETKCSCWDAAQKWVDNMINLEDMYDGTKGDF